jgi:2-keto-4-pentenoate hydratase
VTSKAVQESLGASNPVRGVLLRDMMLKNDAEVPANFGARPIWEPDLIVVVKDAGINEAKNVARCRDHLSEIVGFIELPDRIVAEAEKIDGNLITAINASAGLECLANDEKLIRRPHSSRRWKKSPSLPRTRAVRSSRQRKVTRSSVIRSTRCSGSSTTWASSGDEKLKAGDLISLGSFARPQSPQPGQAVDRSL